ncbi:MAG: hypothetical protein O7E52_02210, partial [Candidatus Poribacteria bacterium]|nr:hypothetical protein [Candidatus Poribacteria bacterium]
GKGHENSTHYPHDSDSQPLVPQDPPSVADVIVADVTREGVIIRWKTDIPATSQVEYGETTNYGRKSRLSSRLVTDHEVGLKNLNLSADYHFRVRSSAGKGQPTTISDDGAFTTASPSFSQDILPIFQISCSLGVRCHADAVGFSKLKLIDYDAMLKGGVSGTPIVPGDAEGSLLFQRITGQKPPPMPLDNPALKPKQIDLIKKWLDAGAKND